MKTISNTPGSGWLSALWNAVAIVALAGIGSGVAIAAPLAGTTIGNQAAATYTDASLTPRTATSNTVVTIVQQVAAFTLTATQSQLAAPGQPVNFPHTITNTGNGTDSFNLTTTANVGTMTLPAPTYYIDANCNGVADNTTQVTQVSNVAPGASACFVAVSTVPTSATSGQTDNFDVVAASALTPATTNSNTDTVTLSSQAVIKVTKSISKPSGVAGTTPVTYTLTYTNTGNAAATSVILADFLPANATYIAASAKSNGIAVTDANDGDVFNYNVTVAGRLTAVIASVGAGQSGTLSYDATMGTAGPPATAPGQIINEARYCYNDGTAVQPDVGCTTTNAATSATAGTGSATNKAVFTILQSAAVAANELAGNTTTGGVTDTVTVASATQGSTVVFNDYIHNNGNGTDTFNVTLTSGTFPAGTTFLLFRSDGVTPLTDSNAIPDGVVDTGPIAAGGYYIVVVKAVLPAGTSGGGAYANVLTATSSFDSTKSDTVTNSLTTITANTVDLTTGVAVGDTAAPTATAGAQGYGAGPSSASVVGGNLVDPGGSATYALYVNNTSTIADSYAITNSALPSGWTVAYFADGGAGNCSTLGATVTNTGIINGLNGTTASNKVVCAVVTVAATGSTSYPGSTNITFTVTSPTSGASDTKLETVTVNTVRSIKVTPPNAGQVFPGGSVVYAHILTNEGNVTEGTGGAGSTITMTDPLSGISTGWSNIVYWDSNNNGSLDPADTVVSGVALDTVAGKTTDGVDVAINGGILPGKSIRLLVKVLSPGSAAAGDINTSSLTATIAGAINSIAAPSPVVSADNTTVIVGQIRLVKNQALDVGCDGTADGAFSTNIITTGAAPNTCVIYQVTATNDGTADVTTLVVSDATPANTTYENCGGAAGVSPAANTTVGTITTVPADGAAGTIQATVGTLIPRQSAVITFAVRINP